MTRSPALVSPALVSLVLVALVPAACAGHPQSAAEPSPRPAPLRPTASFTETDARARSLAYFAELGRVFTHPRCVNCHPSGDSPLAGEDSHLHEPPVVRGEDDAGAIGMRCVTCHSQDNVELGEMSVPGSDVWRLAPASMAWEGLSAGELCRLLKDPERNGDRDLDALVEHLQEDALVRWGWNPGSSREPVPAGHETFGELAEAWVETGAHCPD